MSVSDSVNFTNSVDPDEMPHHRAFHLGLHFLQKYVISIQGFNIVKNERVYKNM